MQRKIGYFFIAFVLFMVILTAILVWKDYKRMSDVGSYEACAALTTGVILNNPDRCVTPNGTTFERKTEVEVETETETGTVPED